MYTLRIRLLHINPFSFLYRNPHLGVVIFILGDAYTAYSGGENWTDPVIVRAVKAFVHRGGFISVKPYKPMRVLWFFCFS